MFSLSRKFQKYPRKVSLEKVLLRGSTRIGGNLGLVRELTLAIYVLLNASRDEVVGGQCFEEEEKSSVMRLNSLLFDHLVGQSFSSIIIASF